jgi:uncharacterized protein (DUF433 family)
VDGSSIGQNNEDATRLWFLLHLFSAAPDPLEYDAELYWMQTADTTRTTNRIPPELATALPQALVDLARGIRRCAKSEERIMNTTATTYEHIQLDAQGVPFIAGTTMKVVELVMGQIAFGWSPEELFFQHPYLTLGQIHAALAYYWDHRPELDADIERRSQFAEAARGKAGPSSLAAKLRAKGLRP